MANDKDDLLESWKALKPVVEEPVPEPVPPPKPPQPKVSRQRPRPPSPPVRYVAPTPSPIEILMSRLFELLLLLVLTASAVGTFWFFWRVIAADGKITSCYVEQQYQGGSSPYLVKGSVDWRSDITMGEFRTVEEAVDGKRKLCPSSP